MATEVNAQIRQNSANSPDVLRNQALDNKAQVEGVTLGNKQASQTSEPGNPQNVSNTDEQLGQTVEELSTLVQSFNRELNFSVDDDSGRTVIKVIDSSTDEIIRQIPSEEVVELAQIIDQHAGLLMDAKV